MDHAKLFFPRYKFVISDNDIPMRKLIMRLHNNSGNNNRPFWSKYFDFDPGVGRECEHEIVLVENKVPLIPIHTGLREKQSLSLRREKPHNRYQFQGRQG